MSKKAIAQNLNFLDLKPGLSSFKEDVVKGLKKEPKELSPKYFYDHRGSYIYDQITQTQEYYPTRTEIGILKKNIGEISDLFGQSSTIIEFGCGSSQKIRLLLSSIRGIEEYVPIDISKEYLVDMSKSLAKDYKDIPILAVCADYTRSLDLSPHFKNSGSKKVVFFPGSTIGNLHPKERDSLLAGVAKLVGPGGGFLIGVDLKKKKKILTEAYNDKAGVTAEFNKNLLVRINSELEGDFSLKDFKHEAVYNESLGRVEMHLVSQRHQQVKVCGKPVQFKKEESIHTESSYKYSIPEFHTILEKAGFKSVRTWTDEEQLFSAHFFSVDQ